MINLNIEKLKLMSKFKEQFNFNAKELSEFEKDFDKWIDESTKLCIENNYTPIDSRLLQRIGNRLYFEVYATVDIKNDMFEYLMIPMPKKEYLEEVQKIKLKQN
jgi:hypothetical protein